MAARPSSPRLPRRSSSGRCPSGKRRYRDRVAALLALAETFPRSSSRREEESAYECRRCGGWHLTSYSGEPFGDAVTLESAL